ncbi:MAG TPA: serine/threonine-protein kinase, partial [Solirubrobacteraceae bacterium]
MTEEPTDSLASLASVLAAVAKTPRVPPILPGTEIAGRYLVVGVVGAGGMGVVYRARDLQLGREVAIKLCSRIQEDGARRLLGEATAMARLSHPHVTHVYEVGRVGDDLFLVMELVAGRTVRGWLAAARRPWRDVVRLYLDAASGLHAVHRAGLVHGDFKPDNLIVDEDGRVRIVDFGLARVDEPRAPGMNGAGGTPRYMAPEVRAGWPPGQLADQYSFCVALAEALAHGGRRPRAVGRILARGLADDPVARHESMATLRHALARRLALRARAFVAAAAVAAVALLGAAGLWIAGRAEANRARAGALRRAALDFDLEQGRRELAGGDARRALAYLSAALEGGLDRPAVRFLLARGLSALEQSYVEL